MMPSGFGSDLIQRTTGLTFNAHSVTLVHDIANTVTYPTRWTPVSLPVSDRARDSAVHLDEYAAVFLTP
jgi:hypothetical protein